MTTTQLAELIATDPPIFMRCSVPELNFIAITSLLLSFATAGLSGVIVFGLGVGVAIAALLSLALFWGMIHILHYFKKGKPPNHYQLLRLYYLARLGLHKNFIVRNGFWGAGRRVHKCLRSY